MALRQGQVDEFMAAQKRVEGTTGGRQRRMDWLRRGPRAVFWIASVQVEAMAVGSLFLLIHTPRPRHWLFKVHLAREEVYRWDIRPVEGDHSNTGCPRGFPAKVRAREHEHFWIEGLGCHCAKHLKGVERTGHEETFRKFCVRTRIEFEPTYTPPPAEQLGL